MWSSIVLGLNCKKNDAIVPQPSNPVTPPPIPPVVFVDEKVVASLQGLVTDEAGKPIENAIVSTAEMKVLSDANGLFRFNNVLLGKKAGYVSVEKDGYFKSGRTFCTVANAVKYTEIQLRRKIVKGSFASTEGGIINIDKGCSITFTAKSIVNANTKELYNGIVNVKGSYLDFSSPVFFKQMHGNFMALDSQKVFRNSKAFDIVSVELEGGSGEKLNLAQGKEASITFPAPLNVSRLPQHTALLHFNDSIGLWEEDGFTTKQGDIYTGKVSHFSDWSFPWEDSIWYAMKYVNVTGKFTSQSIESLAYHTVYFHGVEDGHIKGGAMLDSSGFFSLNLPENMVFKMKLYNRCNQQIYTQDIGPYAVNTDIGEMPVTTTSTYAVTITGNILNCKNETVAIGAVTITTQEGVIYNSLATAGKFSQTITRCNDSPVNYKIVVNDSVLRQKSTFVTLQVTKGIYDAGNINACTPFSSDSINLKLSLKDPQNNILADYKVQLINKDEVSKIEKQSDLQGNLWVVVSKNTQLQLNVFDKCTNLVHTQNIGPFSVNTDIGTISITSVPADQLRITGEVINCDLLPVANGEVGIDLDGVQHVAPVTNGKYSLSIDKGTCDGNLSIAKISANDFITNKQTSLTTMEVIPGSNLVPTIIACEQGTEEYVRYIINDTGYINFGEPAYELSPRMATGSTYIDANVASSTFFSSFEFVGKPGIPANAAGVWDIGYFTLNAGGALYMQIDSTIVPVNVRRHGFLFDFISGSFSGLFADVNKPGTTVKITCDFNVKGQTP